MHDPQLLLTHPIRNCLTHHVEIRLADRARNVPPNDGQFDRGKAGKAEGVRCCRGYVDDPAAHKRTAVVYADNG